MNNNFYFDEENKKNLGEDNSPNSFENSVQLGEVEVDLSEENGAEQNENVENQSTFSTEQSPFNNAENGEFNQPFQQNYYSYQQGYQPYYENSEDLKLYHEKKAIKKTANHIGIGLVLFYIFIILFSNLLAIIAVNKNVYDFINNDAGNSLINILASVLGFGAAGLFILKLQGTRVEILVSFGPPKKKTLLPAVMVGLGFCYVANIVVALIQAKFETVLPFNEPEISMPSGPLGFVISTLSVAVAPALIEEFLFRGVILGSLLKFSKSFAIFVSSLLFALVHGNLVQIPFAFFVGLVVSTMVVETNSFWTGVIIHFINNFVALCLDYLRLIVGANMTGVIYMFLVAVFIVMGFFGYYILSIRNKSLFSFEKSMHVSTSLKKFGWFSSTATIIIYYVIIFFEIFLTKTST